MPWLWSLVRGQAKRIFRAYHAFNRRQFNHLSMLPLEDRVMPASVDPAFFQTMRTNVSDLNGDGVPDLLVAMLNPDPLTSTQSVSATGIRAVNGADGTTLFSVVPFPGFTGPLSLSVADVTGDGKPDIAIGAGFGGGPRVQIIDGVTHKAIFDDFAYVPDFRGGVSVALGDVTGDGRADLVTGAGYGGGPHVRAFDGRNFSPIASFFAYDVNYRGGVEVAVGDLDGDGAAEIVTGTGPGGGSHIQVFSGRTFAPRYAFFSSDSTLRNGSEVAVGDVDGNGLADIVTLSDGRVRAYSGFNPTPFLDIAAAGGRAVSVGNLNGDGFGEVLVSDTVRVVGYSGDPIAASGFSWTATSTNGFAKAPPTIPASAFNGEAIFVPGPGPGSVRADRLRSFTSNGNEVGLFAVDDSTGKIGTLNPGDTGYLAAVIARKQAFFSNTGNASTTLSVPSGHFYGLYATSGTTTLTSFSGANPGGASQFRLLPRNRFALEEGTALGDRDFNDSIGELSVNGVTVPPPPPPPTSGGNIPQDLSGFTKTITGGTTGTVTVTNNILHLAEGNSFRVAVAQPFTIPSSPGVVRVTYSTPNFDTTSVGNIRDAFEIAVLGADGTPLALPTAPQRDASFNVSEGLSAIAAPGTTTTTNTVTINLAALPVGSPAQLVLRLVNNDSDNGTTVDVSRIDYFAAVDVAPTGVTPVIQPGNAGPVVFSTVSDVTPSLQAVYGRTTLTDERTILTTDLSVRNFGTYAITGRVLVGIANLSDPSVGVLDADGVTPQGVPYYDLTNYLVNGTLLPGAASNARTIRFSNPGRERFTYDVQVLAGLNHAPAFVSLPGATVEAGKSYAYSATATDPDGQPLTFAVLGGPQGLTVDSKTGLVTWTPVLADVGSQLVRLRVSDPLGANAEQNYTIRVVTNLPNRPPMFTSTPVTDAKVAGAFEVTTLKVGNNPVGIAAANFGPGGVSIVTANAGDANLTVGGKTVSLGEPRPNNLVYRQGSDVNLGLPAFQTLFDINGLLSAVQGDFNGDGSLDFVVSTFDLFVDNQNNLHNEQKLSIVFGRGDGTFAAPVDIPQAFPVSEQDHLVSLIVKDANSDGKLDIIGSYYHEYSTAAINAPKLFVLLGHGDGTFDAPLLSDTGGNKLGSIRVGDFNRDGFPDLVGIPIDNARAGVLFGTGDGHFGPYIQIEDSTGTGAGFYYAAAVGNLDGVNGDDIVIPDWQRQKLLIYRNDGAGGFSDKTVVPAEYPFYPYGNGTTRPQTVTIGDFDGDGIADMVNATADGGISGGGIGFYKGSGDGKNFSFVSAGQGLAARPVNYDSSNQPVDFNGDGKLDLILGTQEGYYGVSVALNKGNGTFALQTYQNPVSQRSPGRSNYFADQIVLTGDYNRDGVMDVAVAGTRQSAYSGDAFAGIQIIYADTPGVLAAPLDHTFSSSLAYAPFTGLNYAADFNNDGNTDIFGVAFQAAGKIRFGNGDGTFQDAITASPYLGNEFYGSGFHADFNSDGNEDVLWYGGGGIQGGPGARVIIGFNDGTGAFNMLIKSNPDGNYYYIGGLQKGDFNGDGYMDFAGHLGYAVDVWLYDPVAKNNFVRSERLSLPRVGDAGVLEVADFNGDGIPDVLAGVNRDGNVPGSTNEIVFFAGHGDGTFAAGVEQKILAVNTDALFPHWTVSGDLNEDGIRDLIITSAYSRSSVFLGRGDGTFGLHTDYATGTFFASNRQNYLRDVNADGHLDFISIDDNRGGSNKLAVRFGDGHGNFGPEVAYNTGGYLVYLDFADVDNDGVSDLVAGTSVYGGAFSTVFQGTNPGLTAVARGDFNGDGKQDIIAASGVNARVKLLQNNGDDSFARQPDLLVGKGTLDLAATDLDADGDLDILTANRAGRSVSIMTNDGKGHFTRNDIGVGKLLTALAVGDLTGDKLPDIVVAAEGAKSLFLIKNGVSGFTAPIPLPLGDVPGKITIADVTGDKRADVIVSLPQSKRVMILPGDGNGGFGTPLYVTLKNAASGLGVADFNSDGKLDLAVTFPGQGRAAILFGRGGGRFATPQTIEVGANPTSLSIADMNADGRPDILVTNMGDGTASVIINRYDPINLYHYQLNATDPDGDPITFDLTSGPGGMLLNDATGEVIWAPTADQIGLNAVTVSASDGRGGSATQSFNIAVQPNRDNAPPVIFSTAPDKLDASKIYHYTPTAIDPNGDALRYRLLNGPTGATVDPTTGELTWDARNGALNTYSNDKNFGYVQVPHAPLLSLTSLTLEGWFQIDRTDRNQIFFYKQQQYQSGYSTYELRYQYGQLYGAIADNAGESRVGSAWAPKAGTWYHLALTFDDATGAMKVLINGEVFATATTTRHSVDNGSTLYLGGTGIDNLIGRMSQLRIWSVARTPSEIRADLIRDVAPGTPGLVANYRFNDGDAQTVRDSSGHEIHGRRAVGSGIGPIPVPGLADAQTQYFQIQVEDGKGGVSVQNFGVTIVPPLTTSITGTLFNDTDKNGTQNGGETGITDGIVFIDANFNGVRDATEAYSRTNVLGQYTIAGLYDGQHYLAIEPRAGFTMPYSKAVTVSRSGASTFNLAAISEAPGQIRGSVLIDSNANGVPHDPQTVYVSQFDAASLDLSMWSKQIIATSPNGAKVLGQFFNEGVTLALGQTTPLPTHDSLTVTLDLALIKNWYGNNQFTSGTVPEMVFEVSGVELFRTSFSNYTNYPQAYPQATGGSNPGQTGATEVNTLGYNPDTIQRLTFTVPHSDPTATFTIRGVGLPNDINFGSWALRAVKVTAGEPAAVQWPVFLDTNGNNVRDVGELTTLTDSTGRYAFSGLYANTWHVRLDNPAGWSTTAPASGMYDIVLSSGGTLTNNDFVIVPSDVAASQPRFITSPQDYADARNVYRFVNVAVDPGYRPLTYSLAAAPGGMAIDPATGTIIWTPTLNQVGIQRVILKVVNDRGGVALQDFNIVVRPPNSDPIITSTPPAIAQAQVAFEYDVLAQDAEQTTLFYTLETAPSGVSIDGSGHVIWTPGAVQQGVQQFTVVVEDHQGGIARQSFALTVTAAAANGDPSFTGSVRDNAPVNLKYFTRLTATDPDRDPLAFALVSGPAGMLVDSGGLVSWTPTTAQFGNQNVRVSVADGRGGLAVRDFTIDVRSTLSNRGPVITSTAGNFAVAGKLYRYDIVATDADNDPITFELVSGPSGLSLDPLRGTVRWTPAADQFGQNSVTVRSLDPFGGVAEQTFVISVRAVGGPPAITSIPPTLAAVGTTYLYSVKANDAENDPLTFSLLTAPSGMTIDPITGELVWSPTTSDLGSQPVAIQVRDGAGGFATQAFAIQVLAGLPNQPPTISSLPPLVASAGSLYSYRIVASDPEGTAVTYSLRQGPAGTIVNPSTGEVTWAPLPADIGTVAIAFAATDAGGAAAVQSYELQVLPANIAPTINGTGPTTVPARGLYRYDVQATDANLDPIHYELVAAPTGMTVDAFGRIRWQTAIGDLGPHGITVRVGDPRGGITTQSFTLGVVPDTAAPRVTVIPGQNIVRANSPEIYAKYNLTTFPTNTVRVSAVDDVGVTGLVVTANGKPVSLDVFGNATFNFKDWGFGSITVVAKASDAAGNQGTGAKAFAFLPFGDDPVVSTLPNPTVVITSPYDGGTATGFVNVVGSATSDNFTSFTLSYRRADQNVSKTIATGTSKISDGILGKWDTTLLENDEYVLRLEVNDDIFGTTAYEESVGVRGNFKLGNFRLSFADLTIPVAGIPITLARTYDTLRSDRDGDLGFGWRLEFRDTDLRTSLPKSGLEDLGIYRSFKSGTKVYLTLPGGQREGFTFTPEIRVLPGFGNQPLVVATPHFTPDRGVRGALSVHGGTFIVNAAGELVSGGGQPYNPAAEEFGGGYTLTTPEGVVYRIDGNTGKLTTVKDRNNNTLTFTDAGISGSGLSLTFERDAHGRITKVIDPAGNSVKYIYDSRGDLIKVTDRDGNTTQVAYRTDRAHYLDKVIDPLGRTGVRTEYGSDGRLSATFDSAGHALHTSYDPDNSLVTTLDPLGRATVAEYDARGNVAAVTRPSGAVTRYVYDVDGNLLSITDPLGHVTQNTSDSDGNLTSTTDPMGRRISYTYGVSGLVTSITDPLGRTITTQYDSAGRAVSFVDASGRTVQTQYDAAGNPTTVIDPLGRISHAEYDAAGRRTSTTDPTGAKIDYQYDALGNLTNQSTAGKQLGFHYSAGGLPTGLSLAGIETTASYDAAGRLQQVSRPGGTPGTFGYDSSDRLAFVTTSAGTTLGGSSYDAVGNLVGETDTAGGVIQHEYDLEDRIVRNIYPDGSVEIFTYDAAGRLTATTDRRGAVTRYEYDAAGQLLRTIDPLGAILLNSYDAAGQLVSVTDADGNITRYEYDASGQTTAVTDGSGRRTTSLFDGAGRLISVTDGAGRITHYAYNGTDRLSAVTDPAGALTQYLYSAAGPTAVIDANGATTTTEYDAGGRPSRIERPNGEVEFRTYDGDGVLTAVTIGGRTVSYVYNTSGELTGLTTSQGDAETYTYTADGLLATSTNSTGTTRIDYHPQTRLPMRTTEPDGRYVRYQYDLSGNRTVVATGFLGGANELVTSYEYDLAGRLTRMTDPTGGQTNYSYSAAGRLINVARPNATQTAYTYDGAGRQSEVRHTTNGGVLLAGWSYTYDGSGNRTAERAADGSRVEYDYNLAGRLAAEHHFNSSNVQTGQAGYVYDPTGNLIARTGSLLGTATFTYNLAGQLHTGEGRTYTYDVAGNLATMTTATGTTQYQYDARNRLVRTIDETGGQIRFEYDFDGRQTARIDASGRTSFIVDRFAPNRVYQVLRETVGIQTVRSYTTANGPQAETDSTGTHYLHRDAIGSVRLWTNAAGAPIGKADYSAYGLELAGGSGIGVNRFTGDRLDSGTGLYNFRARLYDPHTGRFLSHDPIPGDIRQPASLNSYAYAQGNPTTLGDPKGLTTLAELQTTLQNILVQVKQQGVRYKKVYDQVGETLGIASTRVGGLMIASSLTVPGILGRATLTFFGSAFLKGGYNLLRIGVDMLGGKQLNFKKQPFPPSLYRLIDGQFAIAWYLRDESFKSKTVFALMPGFLFIGLGGILRPFVPVSTFGTPSMAGIMVHEMSHATLDTKDIGYGTRSLIIYGDGGLNSNYVPTPNQKVETPDQALNNADSYRAVAEAVTVHQLPAFTKLFLI